jgi:hypothetical protein
MEDEMEGTTEDGVKAERIIPFVHNMPYIQPNQ